MGRTRARNELALRFLGETEVLRGGRPVELPRSRKTRALLAYLALTGRPHRRERLCRLLWDVPDDPRGALRWSLTKIRGVVEDVGETRIVADRDTLAFDTTGVRIDLLWARSETAAGVAALPTERLVEIAGEFRGELLEGLELTDFLDFHAWCVAERESARALHASVLRTLLERLGGDPEAAVPHARALVRVAPLDEAARARAVRLLFATGRREEAEQQYEAGLRLLAEARVVPSGELAATWRLLGRAPAAAPAALGGTASGPAPPSEPGARRSARCGPRDGRGSSARRPPRRARPAVPAGRSRRRATHAAAR